MENNNALELVGLKKSYPEFTLGEISLGIPRGCITGIIGPNGAGKTTTMKLLMSMVRADSGKLYINGQEYTGDVVDLRNRMGYVGEDHAYYQDRTVKWTGKFVSSFFKDWDNGVFYNYLEKFEISKSKRISALSKGMKAKLSLAIALSHDPEIILMDEPTSGLDPVIRRDVLELLLDICAAEDKTVVLSSHITDDISRIADYIAFMNKGKVVMFREKDELLQSWKRIHFRKGYEDEPVLKGLTYVQNNMFGVSGLTSDYPAIQQQLEEGVVAGNIKVEEVNVDDILISYVKGI